MCNQVWDHCWGNPGEFHHVVSLVLLYHLWSLYNRFAQRKFTKYLQCTGNGASRIQKWNSQCGLGDAQCIDLKPALEWIITTKSDTHCNRDICKLLNTMTFCVQRFIKTYEQCNWIYLEKHILFDKSEKDRKRLLIFYHMFWMGAFPASSL